MTLAGSAGAQVVPVGTASRRAPRPSTDRPRIIVDIKRLTNILSLDETSLIVQVQAGITGLALEELLLPRGLTLGDFPPAALRSTIGGMLSVRTPGKSSPRHGTLENAVLGVSAVLASGRAIHTRVAPRRATGPDLMRALLGSAGSLGILTSVVLRIHRRAETRLLDSLRLPSVGNAVAAIMAGLRKDARSSAATIYDTAEARAHLGATLADGEAILVTASSGAPELAAVDRDLVADEARVRGGTALGPALAEIWYRRRFGQTVTGPVPPAPAFELSAAPSRLAPIHQAIVEAARGAPAGQARLPPRPLRPGRRVHLRHLARRRAPRSDRSGARRCRGRRAGGGGAPGRRE